jgi:hypothetical protein
MVTDDARVLEQGHCQVETYYKEQRHHSGSEFWLLPGCNPGWVAPQGVEITVGGNRADGEGNFIAGAKFLIKEVDQGGYGFGAAVGTYGGRGFVNGIASVALLGDRLVLHANAGHLEVPTWGLGLELVFSPRLIAVAETYGERGQMPTLHSGIRYSVIPERLQVDITRGDQKGDPATRFYTVGVRLSF